MRRYRRISVQIWSDEKFRAMSDDGKLAFMFILTHPHMTSLGAMRATICGLASELGWQEKRLSKAFRMPIESGILEQDSKASYIGVPHFINHNEPQSPNIVKSWISVVEVIPDCRLKALQIQRVIEHVSTMGSAFIKAIESLSEDYPLIFRKGMPIQEQEQEQDKEKEQKENGSSSFSVECAQALKQLAVNWNTLADAVDLPRVKELSKERKASFKERYATRFWRDSYYEALEKIQEIPFLLGKNDRKWKADFEWFLRPGSVAKVLEGKYGKPKPDNGQSDAVGIQVEMDILAEGGKANV